MPVLTQLPPPIPRPPLTVEPDTIHAEWIAPDGTILALSDPTLGWFTTRGVGGWGAVPVSRVDDPAPRGGVTVRHIRDEPRSLTWPLHIWGDSGIEFNGRYRHVTDLFTMTESMGPGILRVARSDGQDAAREILAYYEDGLGGDVGQGWLSANPVLTLFCPNGFWRGVTTETVTRTYQTGTPYLSPYLTVSSGQVLGESSILNPGETDAWPSWVITGPAEQVTATNRRTGESFTLVYALEPGATITVTTDPPTVRGPDGQPLSSALNWPDAELWPLKRGVNEVEFAVSGSGPGTTITLSFVARYQTW